MDSIIFAILYAGVGNLLVAFLLGRFKNKDKDKALMYWKEAKQVVLSFIVATVILWPLVSVALLIVELSMYNEQDHGT